MFSSHNYSTYDMVNYNFLRAYCGPKNCGFGTGCYKLLHACYAYILYTCNLQSGSLVCKFLPTGTLHLSTLTLVDTCFLKTMQNRIKIIFSFLGNAFYGALSNLGVLLF